MAKQLVHRGGFIQLRHTAGEGTLFDGATVHQAALVRTVTCVDLTASGDRYTCSLPVTRQYDLTGTVYLDGPSLFALGDTCHATYCSQHTAGGALDEPLFAGDVVVLRLADTQQQGTFETQDITLRSTGTPTVG